MNALGALRTYGTLRTGGALCSSRAGRTGGACSAGSASHTARDDKIKHSIARCTTVDDLGRGGRIASCDGAHLNGWSLAATVVGLTAIVAVALASTVAMTAGADLAAAIAGDRGRRRGHRAAFFLVFYRAGAPIF